MHYWPCLSCKLEGTAPTGQQQQGLSCKLEGTVRFYGRACKYPKMHYWPCLACKLEGTARFYGKSSKYPKLPCWPYLSWKLEVRTTCYGIASISKCLQCTVEQTFHGNWLEGTARFYGKESKCHKCTVEHTFHAKWRKQPDLNEKWDRRALNALLALYFVLEGTALFYGNPGSASLFAVYRKITWKMKSYFRVAVIFEARESLVWELNVRFLYFGVTYRQLNSQFL